MNPNEIASILAKHAEWVKDSNEGERADLYGADLRNADLRNVDLYGADLRNADLRNANLRNADLRNADLRNADLRNANLRNANLRNADLYGVDLHGAENIPYIPLNCPSDGSFTGWKKVKSAIIKLEIPEDALRLSATTNKCRCDKALVLEIIDLNTNEKYESVTNDRYNPPIEYRVGSLVVPDSFDTDRWNECSHGIHFFINKQDALNY